MPGQHSLRSRVRSRMAKGKGPPKQKRRQRQRARKWMKDIRGNPTSLRL